MSLIAHYKLDGNVNDYSGYGRHGINHGALVNEDGKIGKCYKLDGLGYISLPVSLSASDVGTISMWYNAESAYNFNTLWDTSLNENQWECWIYANGVIATRIQGAVSTAQFPIGSWTHLTFTWDRAGSQRMYLDGELKSETAVNGWALSGNEVNIGGKLNTKGKGLVNDVRIYDHALSEREVRDLSQGLVLHYTFDQFQEPTENKASGITYSSYAPYHNISGDANKVTMVCANTNIYMTIAGFGTLQGKTITVSGYMKKNGASYLPPFIKTSTYETATAVNHVMDSSTGRFEVTQVYDSTSGWLFHTPITAVAGDVITIEDFQVEFNKGYATPFVNGTRAGIVRDQSTQGNDAPLVLANTPKWVEGGMVGKGCYELNQTKYITLPKSTLGSLTNCTFSFWRKRTSAGSWIVGNSGTPAGSSFFMATSGGTGAFYHSGVGTPVIYRDGVLSTTPANDDLWHHYCLVGANLSTWVNLHINAYDMGTTWLFRGQIDDVRIYTTALTTEEIRELYQQRASLDSHGNFYSSLISSNVGYQKVWGDGSGVGFTIYGIDGSSVSTNGVLRFTTINIDPKINMYNIGSFDPNVYKYIQVKYRVVSGNAGDVEIFFTNTQYTAANAAQHRGAPLNSDGNWNVVTVAMHTHPNWTNSNITGWRFDMGTASGVTIEVEWIRLVSDTGALSVKSNKVVGNFSEVGITNGLVAYYPLNKDAKDYSGNGYHGTVTGAVLTGGGFDGKGAYRFDGVDDKITSTQTVPFNLTVFTVSFWISTTTTNNTVVMERGANNGWSIQTMPSHLGVGKIGMVSGGTSSVARSLNTINDGAWHYVAIVNNNAVATVYVDGEDVTLGNVTGAPSYNSVPFIIGQRETDIGVFNGGISNVKIFNRALTPEEIAVEYKRTGVSKMTQHNGTVHIQGQIKETI